MGIKLFEIEPGKWRVDKRSAPVARSALPRPYVISDEMPATEQVDGRFYTSKRMFRAVGRALGLTEVGTEKIKPKQRTSSDPKIKQARRKSLVRAAERYKAGYRPRRDHV